MKRIGLALILGMVFSTAAFAYNAPDRTGKFDAGFNVSGVFPNEDSASDTAYVGGSLDYGINPEWALGFQAGWASMGMKAHNVAGNVISVGDADVIPILANLTYRIPVSSNPVSPYVTYGLGGVIAKHSGNRDLDTNQLSATGSDGFAMKFAGGVDWFVNDSGNWILNLEGGYMWTDASLDIHRFSDGSQVDSKDLDYWYIGGGVKYLFS